VDLALLALGAAALFLKGKADTAKELEFYPQSLALSADKKSLFLIVEVLNPTPRGLEIDSLFLKVYVGKTLIGNIEKTIPFLIRATGRSTIKLPVKVDPRGSGELIALILSGKPIMFRVMGTGMSSGIQFPVEEEIPFKL